MVYSSGRRSVCLLRHAYIQNANSTCTARSTLSRHPCGLAPNENANSTCTARSTLSRHFCQRENTHTTRTIPTMNTRMNPPNTLNTGQRCRHNGAYHHPRPGGWPLGLYTILPLLMLYGIYCNNGGPGETVYCAIVWAMAGRGGRGGGGRTQNGLAKYSIDSCTKNQQENNILYKADGRAEE